MSVVGDVDLQTFVLEPYRSPEQESSHDSTSFRAYRAIGLGDKAQPQRTK
jgi:hypothetical protein